MSGVLAAAAAMGRSQAADGTVLNTATASGSYTFGDNAPNFMLLEGISDGGVGNSSGGKAPVFYGAASGGYGAHHIAVYPGYTLSWVFGTQSSTAGANGGDLTVTLQGGATLTITGGVGATTSAAGSGGGAPSGWNTTQTSGNPGGSPNTWTGAAAPNGGAAQNTQDAAGNAPGGGASGPFVGGLGQLKITAKAT